jgi:hypothetical protein
MKAIDRATRWCNALEQEGFVVEVNKDTFGGLGEYSKFTATKNTTRVDFVVQMDTKYTRFVTGSVAQNHTLLFRANQPSKMAGLVYGEIQMEHYRDRLLDGKAGV